MFGRNRASFGNRPSMSNESVAAKIEAIRSELHGPTGMKRNKFLSKCFEAFGPGKSFCQTCVQPFKSYSAMLKHQRQFGHRMKQCNWCKSIFSYEYHPLHICANQGNYQMAIASPDSREWYANGNTPREASYDNREGYSNENGPYEQYIPEEDFEQPLQPLNDAYLPYEQNSRSPSPFLYNSSPPRHRPHSAEFRHRPPSLEEQRYPSESRSGFSPRGRNCGEIWRSESRPFSPWRQYSSPYSRAESYREIQSPSVSPLGRRRRSISPPTRHRQSASPFHRRRSKSPTGNRHKQQRSPVRDRSFRTSRRSNSPTGTVSSSDDRRFPRKVSVRKRQREHSSTPPLQSKKIYPSRRSTEEPFSSRNRSTPQPIVSSTVDVRPRTSSDVSDVSSTSTVLSKKEEKIFQTITVLLDRSQVEIEKYGHESDDLVAHSQFQSTIQTQTNATWRPQIQCADLAALKEVSSSQAQSAALAPRKLRSLPKAGNSGTSPKSVVLNPQLQSAGQATPNRVSCPKVKSVAPTQPFSQSPHNLNPQLQNPGQTKPIKSEPVEVSTTTAPTASHQVPKIRVKSELFETGLFIPFCDDDTGDGVTEAARDGAIEASGGQDGVIGASSDPPAEDFILLSATFDDVLEDPRRLSLAYKHLVLENTLKGISEQLDMSVPSEVMELPLPRFATKRRDSVQIKNEEIDITDDLDEQISMSNYQRPEKVIGTLVLSHISNVCLICRAELKNMTVVGTHLVANCSCGLVLQMQNVVKSEVAER